MDQHIDQVMTAASERMEDNHPHAFSKGDVVYYTGSRRSMAVLHCLKLTIVGVSKNGSKLHVQPSFDGNKLRGKQIIMAEYLSHTAPVRGVRQSEKMIAMQRTRMTAGGSDDKRKADSMSSDNNAEDKEQEQDNDDDHNEKKQKRNNGDDDDKDDENEDEKDSDAESDNGGSDEDPEPEDGNNITNKPENKKVNEKDDDGKHDEYTLQDQKEAEYISKLKWDSKKKEFVGMMQNSSHTTLKRQFVHYKLLASDHNATDKAHKDSVEAAQAFKDKVMVDEPDKFHKIPAGRCATRSMTAPARDGTEGTLLSTAGASADLPVLDEMPEVKYQQVVDDCIASAGANGVHQFGDVEMGNAIKEQGVWLRSKVKKAPLGPLTQFVRHGGWTVESIRCERDYDGTKLKSYMLEAPPSDEPIVFITIDNEGADDHAACIHRGLIYDSNKTHAMPLTTEPLDKVTDVEGTGDFTCKGIAHAVRLIPTKKTRKRLRGE